MSPFVRDVGQILLDDGSAFRELWAGMHPPRDEVNGGGGSGTTSRRHSVSVVQPRRGNIVGFNAPGASDGPDDVPRSFAAGGGFGGGLMLSDDDLAADLGMLNLSNEPPKASQQPPSQPASLPVYTPLSRSPPAQDQYQPMNIGALAAHGGDHRQRDASPPQPAQEPAHDLQPRFIPGHGIQYLPPQAIQQDQGAPHARARRPSHSSAGGPLSPTAQRMAPSPQQPPYYPARRPSDAQAPAQLADLGRGVPLHAVPPAWPLFIVEFKAGRTDLFYLTDTAQDIRVGDLVVVEADRGKDLGKVVNDSITIAEVEAWQTRQGAGAGGAENPTSPGGAPASKKEISPKMMYGRASVQDTQQLQQKLQDEMKALQLCQSKVRAKKLPMEVIDAEYQWDRRKLTFYFIAEKRIDFRELVRELFRLYKTRIWMASLQGGVSFEQ
ncbi:PSP1 C-terminal conserved region-domain-containing protein [Schizophyllum fasciatum]